MRSISDFPPPSRVLRSLCISLSTADPLIEIRCRQPRIHKEWTRPSRSSTQPLGPPFLTRLRRVAGSPAPCLLGCQCSTNQEQLRSFLQSAKPPRTLKLPKSILLELEPAQGHLPQAAVALIPHLKRRPPPSCRYMVHKNPRHRLLRLILLSEKRKPDPSFRTTRLHTSGSGRPGCPRYAPVVQA